MKENFYNDDVRQYLQMMQANIERMAANSGNCKSWMIVIITAFMGLWSNSQEMKGWGIIVIIPILLFWYLDSFYLQLERGMRNREREFLNILGNGIEDEYKKALFCFKPMMLPSDDKEKGFVSTKNCFISKSTAPFYGITIGVVILINIIQNYDLISKIINYHLCSCKCICQ